MAESRKRKASSELLIEKKITDLPDEILVKIFKYLELNDLLSLTLQCKRFNQIICDGLISIHVSSKNLEADWIGSRKYTKVIFSKDCSQDNLLDFVNILMSIGEDIKTLSMEFVRINPVTLQIILSLCKNLKVLRLPQLTRVESETFKRKMPSLDLKKLVCYMSGLQLLKGTSTRRFSYYADENSEEERDLLQNFLKSQRNLEYLCLRDKHVNEFELFNSEALKSVDFRLKTLILEGINVVNDENFREFINNHADTLSRVKLCNMSGSNLDSFRNVKKIKKLEMYLCDMGEFDVRDNVDELDIVVTVTVNDLAVEFPNLTKIKIISCIDNDQIVKLGKFEKLTHLQLENCTTIHDLTISAATKFIHIDDYEFAKMPTFEEFQFDDIKLINCENVDWLAEFLSKDETQVKNLTIESVELSSNVFKVIAKNLSKITNFVIEDTTFLQLS